MKQQLEILDSAKKLLAVGGIAVIGLVGLSACSDDSGTGDSDDTSTTEGSGGEDTSDSSDEAAEGCEVTAAEDGAGAGYDDPLALCTSAQVENWELAVTAVELDATETVLDESSVNEAPEEGSQYLMFTVTGTNIGEEAADPYWDLVMSVEDTEFRYEDTCGLIPNDWIDVGELAPGETFTANNCLFVDSADVDSAVLAVSALLSMEGEETFYSLT